ncbi:peptidoglycan editing factor PgeF [Ignavibacteriales bacterium]
MVTLKPGIFAGFDNIVCGFSTIIDEGAEAPYFFNQSLSVGDDEAKVLSNRKLWLESLGIEPANCATQKQVHGDTIRFITEGGMKGESDAMITDKPGIAILISSADCPAIFVYDKRQKLVAGIHSGWRGTSQKIVTKTINTMKNGMGCKAKDLFCYIAPSISQMNYEVGEEVAELFDERYLIPRGEKFLLNVPRANYDMLIQAGIPKTNIQLSKLCSYKYGNLLHSYRRAGAKSGRASGIIALKSL